MQLIFNDTIGIMGSGFGFDFTNNNMGIGTIMPVSARLHLVKEGVEGCHAKIEAFNDGSLGPYLIFRRNNGTSASPQPVVAGTRLGEIIFEGRLGIGQAGSAASIACITDSVPDTIHILSRLEFYVGYAKRISIHPNGKVSIDTGVLKLSNKTIAERDALTPESGMVIYNADTNKYQGYQAGSWVDLS